jgi:hypothetical protein
MLYATLVVLRGRGVPSRRLTVVIGVLLLAAGLTVAHMAWAWHLGHSYPPFHVAGSGKWITGDGFAEWWSRGYFLEGTWGNLCSWLWTTPLLALAVGGALWPPPCGDRSGEDDRAARLGPKPRWLFHFWALGCLVLYAVAARWLNEDVYNFHIFNPLGAAFGGNALVGLTRIGRRRLGASIPVLSGAALLVYGFLLGQDAIRTGYAPERNRQSLALGLALQHWSKPEDLVATIASDVGNPIAIYYSRRRGWVFPPVGLRDHPNWVVVAEDSDSVRHFEALRSQGARWFGGVKTVREGSLHPGRFWERHRGFREYLDRTCEIVEESADYVVYRIPPPDVSVSAPPPASGGP